MIVECVRCRTRYRVNELLFRREPRRVRCTKCQHVFVVNRVTRIACSICGIETSHPEGYTIRNYKGSPYAICSACKDSFRGLLEEKTLDEEAPGG